MSVAILFPGQGSQSVGMLAAYSDHQASIQKRFANASEVLGYDLWKIVAEGPEEQLNQTEITQPALLAASVALWDIWQARNSTLPSVMAGHSLGEYSALVCAGSLAFEDAIKLVALRGKLMQEAVPLGQGAMAAIVGLGDADVQTVCREAAAGEVLVPVNYNAMGQVVIAGHAKAVARGVELASTRGAKLAKILPVSVPSHSPLMKEAAHQLGKALEKLNLHSPQIPVIHNVDVKTHAQPEAIRTALIEQLYNPVQWVETVRVLATTWKVTQAIECGPGKVLAGLVKRIEKTIGVESV